MSHSKIEMTRLRELAYLKFIALYRKYPALLNPPLPANGVITDIDQSSDKSSDMESRTRALYDAVYESEYIKSLSTSVPFKQLFRQLESLLANTPEPGILVDQQVSLLKRTTGRMRRELRFLRRYADIVKYDGCEITIPNPAHEKKSRKRFARTSRVLNQRLDRLMSDQFLTDALGQYSLQECRMMLDKLLHMADVFEQITPIYPIARNKVDEISISKTLIHQLADCCFRIYEACDRDVIGLLILPAWLRTYVDAAPDDIDALIAEALVRKVINFDDRISEKPWEVDIGPSAWEPPTAL